MHRHSGRFVDDQKIAIFEYDLLTKQFQKPGSGTNPRPVFYAHRWNPDLVAKNNPLTRLGAAAVDPDFSFAQQAIDAGPWYTLEFAQQEIVDALTLAFPVNFDVTCAVRGKLLIFQWGTRRNLNKMD